MSEPKNLCRVCGVDFATPELFDHHRIEIRYFGDGSVQGRCISPGGMGLVEHKEVWYTPDGLEQHMFICAKMEKARSRRHGASSS